MTHPLRVAENCTTHPLHKAQNLMTHPLSVPAHPPILLDQSLNRPKVGEVTIEFVRQKEDYAFTAVTEPAVLLHRQGERE